MRNRLLPHHFAVIAIIATALSAFTAASAQTARNDRTKLSNFDLDTTEVTIGQFRKYAKATGVRTQAEAKGGGFEYVSGWQQRSGWVWSAPYGEIGTALEPAVHITWHEALAYCQWAGGTLPTAEQWKLAAYQEIRAEPTDNFVNGTTYPYPVGNQPNGMNTSDTDPWPRHAPVGATRRGVNGLYDMGANVWEWLLDARDESALTAGGSWWYGPFKTQENGLQYKTKAFAAVYIGFRCAYSHQ